MGQHDDFATETVFIELERCLTVTVEHEIELSFRSLLRLAQ